MSLESEDKTVLAKAGFIPYEIRQLNEAKAPDGTPQPEINLNSPAWQRVLQSRRIWVKDKVDRDWTEGEIESNLMAYYQRDTKRNPFDFLKSEYKPVAKRDFWENVRIRHQKNIAGSLGKYGRKG